MPKLRVHNFSISLDGYAAGEDQSLDEPLGVGGEQLHNWLVATPTFHKIFGEEGGEEGVDDRFAAAGEIGVGATIMGRNMVDEMHLAYAPLLLGSGERLWEGLDEAPAGYDIAEFVATPAALHVRFVRKA